MERKFLAKRALDFVLVAVLIYVALLALGIIRRGGYIEEGIPAPDFVARSIEDGQELRLSDYRGTAVLLVFFSVGCPSCRSELADVEELQEEAGEKLRVLVLSTDPPGDLRMFMGERGSPLTVAATSGIAHDAYKVDTIPYLVVIDKDGRIRGDYIGNIRWSDIEPWL